MDGCMYACMYACLFDNFSGLSPSAINVTKQLIHGLAQRPHSSHQCNGSKNQRQATTHPGTFAACSIQVARPVMAKSAAPCSQNAAAHISQMWEQHPSSQAPANKAQHTGFSISVTLCAATLHHKRTLQTKEKAIQRRRFLGRSPGSCPTQPVPAARGA